MNHKIMQIFYQQKRQATANKIINTIKGMKEPITVSELAIELNLRPRNVLRKLEHEEIRNKIVRKFENNNGRRCLIYLRKGNEK